MIIKQNIKSIKFKILFNQKQSCLNKNKSSSTTSDSSFNLKSTKSLISTSRVETTMSTTPKHGQTRSAMTYSFYLDFRFLKISHQKTRTSSLLQIVSSCKKPIAVWTFLDLVSGTMKSMALWLSSGIRLRSFASSMFLDARCDSFAAFILIVL